MNTSGSEIKIIAGNSNKELAEKILEHNDHVTTLLGKYFGAGINIKFMNKKEA